MNISLNRNSSVVNYYYIFVPYSQYYYIHSTQTDNTSCPIPNITLSRMCMIPR